MLAVSISVSTIPATASPSCRRISLGTFIRGRFADSRCQAMTAVIRYVAASLVVLLFLLVGLANLRARRWNSKSRTVGQLRVKRTTFRRVWLMTTPPQASLTAFRERKIGRLSVDLACGTADFTLRSGEVITLADLRNDRGAVVP